MPRTYVTPQYPSLAGTQITYSAVTTGAGNGDAVRPNAVLLVKNGSGGALTLTLQTGTTAGNYDIADPTVTVPAGQDMAIGPFTDVFPQQSGADAGWVYVDYSTATSITRAAIAPAG